MTTQTMTIPLNELRIDDKANVRKIGRGAETDFVASIKALGIQMPLIVRKNGKGYVVADGGKRLEAAQALAKSGDMKPDAGIACIVTDATDAEARELSLALNLVRADMHPVDSYRAFASLHTDKEKPLDVQAIATRFGIGETLVQQRLALGALDAKILDAWRDDKIEEDAMRAFTLCSSKKEQVRIFDKLAKQGRVRAFEIRRELKAGENTGRALSEVGIDAYEKRGGKVTRDLFGSNHAISDDALLRTMLAENFDATVKRLEADGWAWVLNKQPDNRYSYDTIDAEPTWTKEDRAEQKRLTAIMEGDPEDADEQSDASYEAEQAIAALEETVKARSYTTQQKAKTGCFVYRDYDGSLKIEYGRVRPEDRKGAAAEQRKAKSKETAPKGKTAPKPAILTNALRDRLAVHRRTAIKAAILADTEKRDPLSKLLGGVVAGLIRPESNYSSAPDGVQKAYDTLASTITPKVMNAALRKAFDAKGYFEGCGKAFCLAAITEAINADEARKISKGKRGEIAKFALANVGKTPWLPKELRTAHYDGPSKTKKAAKAKRK